MNTQKQTFHYSLLLTRGTELPAELAPLAGLSIESAQAGQQRYLEISAEGYDLTETVLDSIERLEAQLHPGAVHFVCENSFYRALCKEQQALARSPAALYLPSEGELDPQRASHTIAIHRINRALLARAALS
ncbi:hypothetical protein [Ferrimonas marina]|uniref:Uncharacterized protein n=1 Tax=Ferrimonas marina TaxID=299255 RepID=A0A1M5XZL4_9GAMM|nr:hypothetical protein [Ferrimonas marina]SHI05182.1 hypothetical protein SAMN02745129_3836 [Ferrimonas marina]